jgi:hypothetical protein
MSEIRIYHQLTTMRLNHTARLYCSKDRILLSQSSFSTIPE